MKHKKIRMNDRFKAFLVERLTCKASLYSIQKLWNETPGIAEPLGYTQLHSYITWASENESSDQIKQLAIGYHESNKRLRQMRGYNQ